MTPKTRKQSRFKGFTLIIVALILIVFAISGLIFFSRSRSLQRVEVVLVSPPQFVSQPTVLQIPQPSTADYLEVTQNFYRAEVQVRNLGTSSIAPVAVNMEIMEADPTDWISANQWTVSNIYPPIKPGDSMNFPIRIPASATKWRFTCINHRWFLPQQIINYVLRDRLNLQSQVGDSEIHEAQSETCILEKPKN